MNRLRTLIPFRLPSLAFLSLALTLAPALPDEAPPAGAPASIRFLRLRADADNFRLLSASVRPGVLKQPRDGQTRGDLLCELLDAEGRVLWHTRVADPLRRRFEMAAPDHPGEFTVKEQHLAGTDFTLRVPHLAEATELRLVRAAGASAGRTNATSPRPARIALPVNPS